METHLLSAANVADVLDVNQPPFVAAAARTQYFWREPDERLRDSARDSIARLAHHLGIHTTTGLGETLGAFSPFAGPYFTMLATTNSGARCRSETDFLSLLALIGARATDIEPAILVSLGWSADLAENTIANARRFGNQYH